MSAHRNLIAVGLISMIGSSGVALGKEAQVELKYMVPVEKRAAVIKSLHLEDLAPSTTRVVCFYDTPSLNLFKHRPQIILRSRYSTSGNKETDVTVKIRETTTSVSGAKHEFDQVIGKSMVESWSLTDNRRSVEDVQSANRGVEIKKLFTEKQEKLMFENFSPIDWDRLIPVGPVIGVKVWNLTSVASLQNITVERWELPNVAGESARILFEVSTKVPVKNVAAATKALSNALGFDLVTGDDTETKTKLVLEHFIREK